MANNGQIKAFEPRTREDVNKGEISSCWHAFDRWDEQRVNSIIDSAGANAKREITSYPSPIARIHLFNDAFEFYNNTDSNGNNKHEKIISDCLDVWEILFYYDLHRQNLKLSFWGFSNIDALLQSEYEGHHLLADSLDLFIRKDKNKAIKSIKGIHIIRYGDKVIAGSSPFTGFFTAPDLDEIMIPIPGDAQEVYFQSIRHINERDIEFQKFMHTVARSQNVAKPFKALYEYIKSFQNTHEDIQKMWSAEKGLVEELKEAYDNNYELIRTPESIRLLENAKDGGFELRSFRPKVDTDCHFIIQSSIWKGRAVLALKTKPEGPGNKKYVTGMLWDDALKVPVYIEDTLDYRTLPGVNIEHPWVSINDFLEDYLVKLPYNLNDDAYVINTNDGQPSPYLLPLKPLVFEFFTLEEIKEYLTISFTENSLKPRVKVTLMIPVASKVSISFVKEYDTVDHINEVPWPEDLRSAGENRGYIVDYYMGLWLYPFIRTGEKKYDNFYRVGYIDRDLNNPEASLTFYQRGKAIYEGANTGSNNIIKKTRTRKTQTKEGSQYYALEGDGNVSFDAIGVSMNIAGRDVSAMVLPDWTKCKVNIGDQNKYAFAADFGTTNTHLAYRKNSGSPKAFEVGIKDMPIARLDRAADLIPGISETDRYDNRQDNPTLRQVSKRQRHEFIPSIIGEKYSFPIRTAMSQAHDINTEGEFLMLANANIAFAFNQSFGDQSEEKVFTNIKWGTDPFEKERMRLFVNQLLIMIRTKVLMNQANPSSTKLYWFVPLSMSHTMKGRLSEIWNTSFQRIFGTSRLPVLMTESEAPFHKMQRERTFTGKTSLTIDIGGGTTDALIFHKDEVQLATSFGFAGNTVFGDFSDAKKRNNGIVRYFKDMIEKRISEMINEAGDDQKEENRVALIRDAFDWYFDGDSEMKSEDIASFFFSQPEFRFADKLKETEDFKFVFLLFFTALQYHCATIIKEKGLPAPDDVCLSGNGSKILQLISADRKELQKLIQSIYREVLGDENPRVSLHIPGEPKEITCYGALYLDDKEPMDSAEKTHYPLGENLTWKGATPEKITFKDIKDAEFDLENSEYLKFHKLFFKLYEQEDFSERFGVRLNDISSVKEFMREHAAISYERGLKNQSKREVKDNEQLKETVFFFSISGLIYDLLNEFTKKRQGQESALK